MLVEGECQGEVMEAANAVMKLRGDDIAVTIMASPLTAVWSSVYTVLCVWSVDVASSSGELHNPLQSRHLLEFDDAGGHHGCW